MRWWILAVLFTARLSMAFQFQAVAALTPLVRAEYGVGLSEIGLLIGLYLAPGIVVAIPGSALAARFGDKRVVAAGLCAMLAGAVLPLLLPGWNVAVASRLLAGAGGVVLNIVMTKMLVDWFAGREISTALAVFVNSWPVGIAIALAVLPLVSDSGGLASAGWTVAAVVAVGLLLFTAFYRPAPGAAPAGRLRFVRLPVAPVVLAGLVWAFYNGALAMVFSFGPAVLTAKGWSLAEAGSAVSLFMLVFSVAVPLGGVVADRTGRGDAIIVVSMASFAVLMPWVPALPPLAVTTVFVAVGVLFALAAGPVMALPSRVLTPEARGFGMGVFFSIYYGVMMVAPRVAGGIAEDRGDPGAAFPLGAVMALTAVASLWGFHRTSARIIRAA